MERICFRCNTTHPQGQRCPHQRNGSTRAWRNARQRILKRDGYQCQECGAQAHHVDHIDTHAMGGSDNPNNLQALCADCNLKKGNS